MVMQDELRQTKTLIKQYTDRLKRRSLSPVKNKTQRSNFVVGQEELIIKNTKAQEPDSLIKTFYKESMEIES